MTRRARLALIVGAPAATFTAGAALGLAGVVGGGIQVQACPFTFGATVIRAEIVCMKGGLVRDIRVDRGRITAVGPGRTLAIQERDGTAVTIPVAPTARITLAGSPAGFNALKKNMRVQTQREGDGPADTVDATRH
jgi:hypothetical protein